MSVYIDNSDRYHNDQAQSLALTCPHCSVFAHQSPLAVPHFATLMAQRPKQVGIIYRCDSCNSPVFLRFNVRGYEANRIELSSQFSEVERPPEKFSFSYLPEPVETMFREALQCYSISAFNAFASMCRRTMQEAFAVLGESGKLRLFDELNDLREMAEIDNASFTLIKRVIFGTDADPAPSLPTLDDEEAALLLEVMKDLLYQAYVRKGRLQQAMVIRRFFSEEAAARQGAPSERAERSTEPLPP